MSSPVRKPKKKIQGEANDEIKSYVNAFFESAKLADFFPLSSNTVRQVIQPLLIQICDPTNPNCSVGPSSQITCPEKWCDLKTREKSILCKFRKSLVDFIVENICQKSGSNSTCVNFGSEGKDSNVDISIKSEQGNLISNIDTLHRIQLFLLELFKHVCIFYNDNGNVSLYKIYRFFDMNFYLTDFELGFTNNYTIVTTTVQKTTPTLLSQYFYAFYELFQIDDNNSPFTAYAKMYNDIYNARLETLQTNSQAAAQYTNMDPTYANIYQSIIDKYNLLKSSNTTAYQTKANDEIIDLVSLLSTFEDECYHTQGAYYHVVHLLQKPDIIQLPSECTDETKLNIFCASAIENLCYAYTHASKQKKYLGRVNDALKAATEIKINPTNSGILNAFQVGKTSKTSGVLTIPLSSTQTDIQSILANLLTIIFVPSPLQTSSQQQGPQGGATKNKMKKLLNKHNEPVKKHLQGRTRQVYIDSSRKQYVLIKGNYVRVTHLSASSKVNIF